MPLDGVKDHPHLRGEKWGVMASVFPTWGSSPLARGKVEKHGRIKKVLRIIPACAGKSKCVCSVFVKAKDHPRLRGEKVKLPFSFPLGKGSSPLARGKASISSAIDNASRIIPACAGKRPPYGA